MHDPNDMTRYYGLRASEYEQIYYRDMPARRKEIDDEILRVKELVREKSVLDIPCGTGYWSLVMDETASEIVAADLSAEMLDEARNKNYKLDVPFVRANVNHPPFRPAQFDLVALGFWLSHHPRQELKSLFKAISILARPDGRIWMIENNPPAEGPEMRSVKRDEFGNNFKERFLDDGSRFVIMKNYFSESELVALFESHFAIERLTYGKYYWSTVLSVLEASQ